MWGKERWTLTNILLNRWFQILSRSIGKWCEPLCQLSSLDTNSTQRPSLAPLSLHRGRSFLAPSKKNSSERMRKGIIWATAEDMARNRGTVLSLYRQILRSLNSSELPLTHAARLAKKAEVRSIFLFGAEERSLHNIGELIDAAKYSLSVLKKGRLP